VPAPHPSRAETIVALASGPGHARRAVVRLSGPATCLVLAALDAEPESSRRPRERGTSTTRLRIAPALSVPVQVLRYLAPRSFTGEDAAEVLLCGNPWLTERLVTAMCQALAPASAIVRTAQPGEFAARAYLAGKLTLAQAEAIAAIIAAGDADELAAARRVLAVGSGAEAAAAADELVTLLALVEAGIDFADTDDVVAISSQDLLRRAQSLALKLDALAGHARPRGAALALPIVALFGEPNAGKSTLFNALLGRSRAVVSAVAGTTRDALVEPLTSRQGRQPFAMLADLPGVDDAAHAAHSAMQDAQPLGLLGEADVVVWCDPTGRFEAGGGGGAGGRGPAPSFARVIRVATKADVRPIQGGRADGSGGRPDASRADLSVCAVDGRNIAELVDLLERSAWAVESGTTGPAVLLPQHRQAAAKAAALMHDLCSRIDVSNRVLRSPELIASQLRDALAAMAPLTGRVHPDDIVGRIFGMFCIGK